MSQDMVHAFGFFCQILAALLFRLIVLGIVPVHDFHDAIGIAAENTLDNAALSPDDVFTILYRG